jgi:DNA helicase-2/ATP-dependent DNA helicase PcrA
VEAAALCVQQAMQKPLGEPQDTEVLRLAAEREKTAGNGSAWTLASRVRISASSLEALATDAKQYWENLERPVPQKPHRAALRGTLFHQYVEQRLGVDVAVPFVDLDTDSTEPQEGDVGIEHWIEAFEASEFAHQTPVAIEAELHMPLGQHIVVCKMDAVFPEGDGVHIVDWKTGAEPTSPEELAAKALQLAAYRLAWSQWSGLELPAIRASFWFSETKKLVTPDTLATLDELDALVREALGD